MTGFEPPDRPQLPPYAPPVPEPPATWYAAPPPPGPPGRRLAVVAVALCAAGIVAGVVGFPLTVFGVGLLLLLLGVLAVHAGGVLGLLAALLAVRGRAQGGLGPTLGLAGLAVAAGATAAVLVWR